MGMVHDACKAWPIWHQGSALEGVIWRIAQCFPYYEGLQFLQKSPAAHSDQWVPSRIFYRESKLYKEYVKRFSEQLRQSWRCPSSRPTLANRKIIDHIASVEPEQPSETVRWLTAYLRSIMTHLLNCLLIFFHQYHEKVVTFNMVEIISKFTTHVPAGCFWIKLDDNTRWSMWYNIFQVIFILYIPLHKIQLSDETKLFIFIFFILSYLFAPIYQHSPLQSPSCPQP